MLSVQLGRWGADDLAFLRLWEVSHAWAVVAEHVEEVRNLGGRSLDGKVVCVPGLEEGWV